MQISPASFLAIFMIFVGLVIPLFSHAMADDPVTKECASTQPELRKFFRPEMEVLKNFEGSWASPGLEIKQGEKPTDMSRAFWAFNANKKEIRVQQSAYTTEGHQIIRKDVKVKICRTEANNMRVFGDGVELDIGVLTERNARFLNRLANKEKNPDAAKSDDYANALNNSTRGRVMFGKINDVVGSFAKPVDPTRAVEGRPVRVIPMPNAAGAVR